MAALLRCRCLVSRSASFSSRTLSTTASRWAATETATPQASTSTPPPAAASSPKIDGIVDQIQTLSLLEASELVQALKVRVPTFVSSISLSSRLEQTRLNIADISYAAPAASAGPAAGAASAPAEEATEEEKPKEKTLFTVNLTKIDASAKAKAIKEVKALMPSMNLVEVPFPNPYMKGMC